jgi:hypothetical protein
MILAMAFETNILQDDHLVIAVGLFEGALQLLDWIDLVAGEIFLEGARHARRRAAQSFARRIVAGPAQQHAHRLLRLLARRPANGGNIQRSAFARGSRRHERNSLLLN